MMKKSACLVSFFAGLLLVISQNIGAQVFDMVKDPAAAGPVSGRAGSGVPGSLPLRVPGHLLEQGLKSYSEGKWLDAVSQLTRAKSEAEEPATFNPEVHAEALYWLARAELRAGEYEASLGHLEELEKNYPATKRALQAAYEKGRALFYLGQHDDAVVSLSAYAATTQDQASKASAFYWIGECLYARGRLDEAQNVFARIMAEFPASVKYEAASYRAALINQKKIEIELLKLLKWSHEESLKMAEEYQRRERSYDQAITAYQKRILELSKENRTAESGQAGAEERPENISNTGPQNNP